MEHFDHIIIGTGQATGTLLSAFLKAGSRVAVLEGWKVGGSCVNYGCTPTKTLVASAKAFHTAQRGAEYGFSTGPVQLDYSRVLERMNSIRNSSNEGMKEWMEGEEQVTFLRGWGEFTGPKTVRCGEEELRGERIYINTGAKAVIPPIDGLEEVPYLNTDRMLELNELPEHLLIIGGGYIGVEFAQIYRRFGCEVTLIENEPHLMAQEDEDTSEAIEEILAGEGVTLRLGAKAVKAAEQDGGVQLTLDKDGKQDTVSGSHLLLAVGRRPNTDRLALEKAGIETTDKGYIAVDDYCRTSVPGIFAVGDVNGQGAFTHTSVNDAEIVLDFQKGGGRKLSDRIPIYALFSDPPLGRVGLTERQAAEQGYRVLRAKMPMEKISRAKEMGQTEGFAKLLVDGNTDRIIGAAILGPNGDEIINMFAAIMHSDIPCHEYRKVVLVHPTVSELMPFVLDGLEEVDR